MNRARKRAARMAVFIECAGLVPILRGSTYGDYCKFLEQQYTCIEPESRRRARVMARRQLREQGVASAAILLIPVPLPCEKRTVDPKPCRKRRVKYRD